MEFGIGIIFPNTTINEDKDVARLSATFIDINTT